MKSYILLLLFIASIAFFTSCNEDEILLSQEIKSEPDISLLHLEFEDSDNSFVEELSTKISDIDTRSSSQLIYSTTKTINQGSWSGVYASSSYFQPGFVYRAVLTPISGDPDLYIYGYSPWRYIRHSVTTSIDESYIEKSDLFNSETRGYWWVYGYTNTTYKLEIYKEAVSYDINLSGFEYVYQNQVYDDWEDSSKYSLNGSCEYPNYIGNFETSCCENTNLCGLASLAMAISMVPHDTYVEIPSNSFDKTTRLVELARRYKIYDSVYDFGDFAYIHKIGYLADGNIYNKGEFTEWDDCSDKANYATILKSTTNREVMKSFIREHISNDIPVLAIATINANYGSADNSNYFVESGGIGHYVVITGVTENDFSNTYTIRFKDPWTNNPKTYEANYTSFLNSMTNYPNNYNALAILGQ